jgi:hypothetical protein
MLLVPAPSIYDVTVPASPSIVDWLCGGFQGAGSRGAAIVSLALGIGRTRPSSSARSTPFVPPVPVERRSLLGRFREAIDCRFAAGLRRSSTRGVFTDRGTRSYLRCPRGRPPSAFGGLVTSSLRRPRCHTPAGQRFLPSEEEGRARSYREPPSLESRWGRRSGKIDSESTGRSDHRGWARAFRGITIDPVDVWIARAPLRALAGVVDFFGRGPAASRRRPPEPGVSLENAGRRWPGESSGAVYRTPTRSRGLTVLENRLRDEDPNALLLGSSSRRLIVFLIAVTNVAGPARGSEGPGIRLS